MPTMLDLADRGSRADPAAPVFGMTGVFISAIVRA
jgi:hypothetical protein